VGGVNETLISILSIVAVVIASLRVAINPLISADSLLRRARRNVASCKSARDMCPFADGIWAEADTSMAQKELMYSVISAFNNLVLAKRW